MDDSKFGLFAITLNPFIFLRRFYNLNTLYLCNVLPDYVKFLHKIDFRVSVKYNNRAFVGIITMINGINYVLPLTSQTTDARKKLGKQKRSARITTFIRDGNGLEIANILHNNMIPVLPTTYTKINIDPLIDTYELNEIRFIRKNKNEIINKAIKVHDDRINKDKSDTFLYNTCCDFALLERECIKFLMNIK